MLNYSFTSTERSRNTICTTFSNREECINKTSFCYHCFCRCKTFCITVNSTFNRPFKTHLKFMVIAFFICYNGHFFCNCVRTSRCYFLYSVSSKQTKWNKNLVCKRSFWNRTDRITSLNCITRFYRRSPFPFSFLVESINVNTSFKEEACFFCNKRKRILQTIINLTKKSRSKKSRKKVTCKFYNVTSLNTLCHFKNLKLCYISADTDNFASKLCAFNINVGNFVHGNISVKLNRNHVSIDTDYFTFCFCHYFSPSIVS